MVVVLPTQSQHRRWKMLKHNKTLHLLSQHGWKFHLHLLPTLLQTDYHLSHHYKIPQRSV